jgi:hypothetical protein
VVEEPLLIRSGATVRRMALSYTALAADAYWIRTIQYYGGIKRKLSASSLLAPPPALSDDADVAFPLLYAFLDLTTTLDPRFNVAYRFGAIFLAEPYPNGPDRPDLAIALLEKGLRERADKWEYMRDIGFVHYWYRHDYLAAGQWFGLAAKVPGSPVWLKSLAATTVAQGGDRRSSRQMWTAILESAEVDWLRQYAERSLLQLRALDELETIRPQVAEYLRQTGQRNTSWQALIRARVVRGILADPSGAPYVLTPDGGVELSPTSPLGPLPQEPESARQRPPA